jgi:hypothetical protein
MIMRQAELAWVRSFQNELETGTLRRDPEEMRRFAAALPQSEHVCPSQI